MDTRIVTENTGLTDRQRREIAYHKTHAELVRERPRTLSHDVLYSERRKWWNAYWDVFTYLKKLDLKNKKALVVGCGAGEDAVRLAKLGMDVYAFDLSTEMLAIASEMAAAAQTAIHFSEMPAEKLDYPDGFFDLIFARDIFHHVDIPAAMSELRRVARPGSILIANEIYSHSVTELIRRSSFVEKVLYPRMQSRIYGGQKPYITEDERKLSERDVAAIAAPLTAVDRKFFNFIVTRIVSDKSDTLNAIDRMVLKALGPLAQFCGGRIVIIGRLSG
jgi:ubiquinone/menaquinone biosynthesis C-methylase UbiE